MTVIHATDDESCCKHYDVDDPTFVCPECGRTVGYCMGADDDYPELCADCWVKHNQDHLVVSVQDIDTDLAPLSPEECEKRGIRHSSCDDNRLVEFDILWGCDLRNAARSVGL